MVGQRFIERLANHPFFELSDLAASSKSAGKKYDEAAKWVLSSAMPEEVRSMPVREVNPKKINAEIVFSALPSEIAREVEPKFAKEGFIVASNASAHRMEKDVPIIVPEVNPGHLDLLEVQKENRGWDGCIFTDPNCSIAVAVISLKPIYDKFGIKSVFITTMQAVSGAGYAGVPSMAITENVIPFIKNEERKVETEGLKILGRFDREKIIPANFRVSASCNRVPVLDGHTESIFVETRKECSIQEVKKVMKNFRGLPQKLKLPTAPENPIIVTEEENRPQPRLDRYSGKGMAVTVGRIREDPILDFKYTVLGHNTVRGAAGNSVLSAELLVKTKKI